MATMSERRRRIKNTTKLSTLTALVAAVQSLRSPDAVLSFGPIAARCSSPPSRSRHTKSSLLCAPLCGALCAAATATRGAEPRSCHARPTTGRGSRLPLSPSAAWGRCGVKNLSGGVGSHSGGSSSSSTALYAFWSRSTDPEGTDETKRSSNSLWRKILPGGGGGNGGVKSDPGTAPGRTSSPALAKRKRTTGRNRAGASGGGSGGGSNRSRTTSSSARYYYSVALVNEMCPSYPQSMDGCTIDDSVYDLYDPPEGTTEAGEDGQQKQKKQQPNRAGARLVENGLDAFIHRHALHTLNLRITSDATRLSPVLLRGRVGSVELSFDRLAFPALKLSGGGQITATGLDVNTASFVPPLGRVVRTFYRPFEFHATNCVLTQEDIENSYCIRNGLAHLFTRILKHVVSRDTSLDVVRIDRGAKVAVHEVEVLETNMLSCRGTITTILGSVIPFEVKTGLRKSRTSGHVLHFPGLEVTLNPHSPLQGKIPLHLLLPVDLDIGDNALVEKLEIDGRRKQLKLSMRTIVTPSSGRSNKSKRKSKPMDGVVSYRERTDGSAAVTAARYSCDIGQWLTKLGRF